MSVLTSEDHQLVKVVKQDDANTTLKTLEFTYDALGRRASKTIDGVTQNYLYDGEDIIAILDSNNNPISIITHGESIDTPLAIRTNNESYFYQRDHQGSITSLTDSNQNKVQEYIYTDAYGTTQVVQTLDTNNPYAYTGRELDDTDLYYYRARYYDPSTQRFLSQDPIGFASGDFNFYRYVGNSPGNFRDPSGLTGLGLPWNKKPTIGNGIGGRIPLKGGRSLYVDKNGNICPQNSYMGSSKQTRMQEQQWLNDKYSTDNYKHSQTTRGRGRGLFDDILGSLGDLLGG